MYGGGDPFFIRYNRISDRIRYGSGGEEGEQSGNPFMRLRYIISRIGINPNDIEIDEGMELARLWIEEKSQQICPFMGI